MTNIKSVHARQIFDSRGKPTIETIVVLENGLWERSSVASGITRGENEAVEMRDNDPDKYRGMGVDTAIKNVNEVIGPKIIGMDAYSQTKVDAAMIELDGTPDKSTLGANAILSVSQAVAKAAARNSGLSAAAYIRQFVTSDKKAKLPIPMFNMLEGGKHGVNLLNFQEFLIIPASSKTYQESLDQGIAIYNSLKRIIIERSQGTLLSDQAGFSPQLATNVDGFKLLKEAVETAGISYSLDVFSGLDAAANSFMAGNNYTLKDKSTPYSTEELIEYYKNISSDYSLIYLEDPFAQDDWEGWDKIQKTIGEKIMISADNLTKTNPYRLQMALDKKVLNGIVIKPIQIGTITEAIAVAEIAKFKGLKLIVAARSGETSDPFIADFAVGIMADYVKFGAPARERMSKYNRLLELQDEIKET